MTHITAAQRARALWLCTIALAACVAVWLVFSIVGITLQEHYGLSGTQYGLLLATPILTGSLSRLPLGIWAEMFGARRVMVLLMLVVSAFTFALPFATTFTSLLLISLGLGLSGGAFAVGVVYVSSWYPLERQGMALGLFGMGNVGTALTGLAAPLLLARMNWQHAVWVYAAMILIVAVLFFLFTKAEPAQPRSGARPSLRERLEPLHNIQVWRFSLYYFLVFGGFVALASWLPRYYIGVYKVDVPTAGMLAASFLFPATLFRSVGGALADRFGPRLMMYGSFAVCVVGMFMLSYPSTHYIVEGIRGPIEFTIAPTMAERAVLLAIVGLAMAVGMAAVFKNIPKYYPHHVGAVGGVVSMIGGLGGFFLPIAFGMMNDLVGIWSSCFMLLFVIAATNLAWMHFAVRRMDRSRFPEIAQEKDLPEIMEAQVRRTQTAASNT